MFTRYKKRTPSSPNPPPQKIESTLWFPYFPVTLNANRNITFYPGYTDTHQVCCCCYCFSCTHGMYTGQGSNSSHSSRPSLSSDNAEFLTARPPGNSTHTRSYCIFLIKVLEFIIPCIFISSILIKVLTSYVSLRTIIFFVLGMHHSLILWTNF